MTTITLSDKKYPLSLRNITDPPKQLYVLGDIPKGRKIAVVGTRQISDYGKKVTTDLTRALVKEGFIIVSGMAIGVDAAAHWAAIKSGGKTIAVLGAGVDVIYPPENTDLYNSILDSGGAVISEVPLGKGVRREMFPARNRIVSGLSEAVIIVEAAIKSGSLITARLALEQGRDVFAVPGSPGTDYLIEQGATGVISKDVVVDSLGK